VLALQIFIGSDRYGAEAFVPQIVVIGITRELGPVIAGLMVAGRVAAAIAAEIGTMRVTEQIDALTTLATNPIKYLVVPRLIAAVISMPILVAIADSIGVFGGYVVATQSLGFTGSIYLKNTIDFVTNQDISSGLIKATVFGFIIALMGCYNGFHSKGGAQGVGSATTNAVVSASILILAANYILTSALFSK
jgi:phospholipid/cholesterol/gamma-HCH transport system permease protein